MPFRAEYPNMPKENMKIHIKTDSKNLTSYHFDSSSA